MFQADGCNIPSSPGERDEERQANFLIEQRDGTQRILVLAARGTKRWKTAFVLLHYPDLFFQSSSSTRGN